MATIEPATDEQPLLVTCPKCGVPLRVHTSRGELDGNRQLEFVYSYLCLQHGFFTFRNSKGLVAGL